MTRSQAIYKLISWAISQIGYHETGDNITTYADNPDLIKLLGWHPQKQPWCDFWTDVAFIVCFGLDAASRMTYQPIGRGSAACRYSAQFFKDHNAFFRTPEAGDVIFFYDKSGQINHQGLVEKVSGGIVYTIEGNKSDQVGRGAYAIGASNVAGFGRPDWSAVVTEQEDDPGEIVVVDPDPQTPDTPANLPTIRKGDKGEAVRVMQVILIAKGYSCGPDGADGDYGNNTYKALTNFQAARGLDPDGICGPKTHAELWR